jgi:hypothetical protein
VLGSVRRRLESVARQVGRPDLATVFEHPDGERLRQAKAVADAIEVLRHARIPTPQISDDIGIWLPARAVTILRAHALIQELIGVSSLSAVKSLIDDDLARLWAIVSGVI